MSRHLSILLLETDTLPVPDRSDHDRPSSAFHKLLTRCGTTQNPPISVSLTPCYVVGPDSDPSVESHPELPDISSLDKYTGVLITGSKHDAHDNAPWIRALLAWLRDAWQAHPHLRFSGVCFGHQILSRLLGGHVDRHPETWELAYTEIKLSPIGQRLFDAEQIGLHMMHQDHVVTAPVDTSKVDSGKEKRRVAVWGSSKDCEVQGLYACRRILTSQGHLGYDEAMVRESIEQHEKQGTLEKGSEETERAKEKSELEHDGDVVGGAVVRFFAGLDDEIEVE
ncbi:class I glutamine amidotransferase-like protein [Geopyxis carbonaria]|nr:class I glutamine amidotransferase-like protein [Geopyxis carbonaria]